MGYFIFGVRTLANTAVWQEDEAPTRRAPRRRGGSLDVSGDLQGTTQAHALADFEPLVARASSRLIESIERKLEEDRQDAEASGEAAPTQPAAQECLGLAKRLLPHVALAPRLSVGAFTEDDGGISLVVQSFITDRRLNCRIPPGGTPISAIRIDEHMQADSIVVALDEPTAPKELAEWVTKRA